MILIKQLVLFLACSVSNISFSSSPSVHGPVSDPESSTGVEVESSTGTEHNPSHVPRGGYSGRPPLEAESPERAIRSVVKDLHRISWAGVPPSQTKHSVKGELDGLAGVGKVNPPFTGGINRVEVRPAGALQSATVRSEQSSTLVGAGPICVHVEALAAPGA